MRSALYGDGGLLCGSHWLLRYTNPRGNGDGWGGGLGGVSVQGKCARQVCKVSVQGECESGEVLYMGIGGCCAAASLHKSKGEW